MTDEELENECFDDCDDDIIEEPASFGEDIEDLPIVGDRKKELSKD